MSDSILVYGASGYTGTLITNRLVELGVRPVLAGRNAAKLAAIAEPLGLAHRVARLDDADALDRALREITVVLHTAGPFSETGAPMLAACLRAHAHYLDV